MDHELYCKYCGTKMVSKCNRNGTPEISMCSWCRKNFYTPGFSAKNKDTYCRRCGYVLEKRKYTGKFGKEYWTSARIHECDKCKADLKAASIEKQKKPRFCRNCNSVIVGRRNNAKVCLECAASTVPPSSSVVHRKNTAEAHRKAAREWQKNHYKKYRVASKAYSNSHLLKILYECPCDAKRKHNHHFDYDRPYEVIRLCASCHRYEHERLKRLAMEGTPDQIKEAIKEAA